MELYQLRTFVTVAEEEHLTRAAVRLNASQPAVSSQIKALEEELGVPLFMRSPRGMLLTDPGRSLMEQARKTLGAAEEVLIRARGLREEAYGEARLGLNNEPHRLRVPDFILAMRRRHPRVDLHLRQSSSPYILDEIKAGSMDAGFVYANICEQDPEVDCAYLETVPMAVIGPVSWEERLREADWGDLAACPWIWFPQKCPFKKLFQDEFERRGLSVRTVMVSDSDATLKTLAAAGYGLTVIRMDDAILAREAGEICIWPGGAPELSLTLVHRKERREDAVIRALVKTAREVWGVRGR